jgi:hypothetical protein
MTTFQTASTLSKPSGTDKVPSGTFGYFQSRNKHRAYSLVMEEFKASGLSQADLAHRLGKGTDIVCRWLSGPGNWTLDTLSDLLFAISGAAPAFGKEYPLDKPTHNYTRPDWLTRMPARTESANGGFFRIPLGNPPPEIQTN